MSADAIIDGGSPWDLRVFSRPRIASTTAIESGSPRGNMADNSRDRLTLARQFLVPSNATHRQYEALRAFFVDGLPSAQAAARFGYTPGSFRVLVPQFRRHPGRDFFLPTAREGRPPGKQTRLREQ